MTLSPVKITMMQKYALNHGAAIAEHFISHSGKCQII
jgi:hypothetical protein